MEEVYFLIINIVNGKSQNEIISLCHLLSYRRRCIFHINTVLLKYDIEICFNPRKNEGSRKNEAKSKFKMVYLMNNNNNLPLHIYWYIVMI